MFLILNPKTPEHRHAGDTDILTNTVIVDKDGNTVEEANSRFADDEIVIDDNCTASGTPDDSCVGFRQKLQRSTNVARCADNNQTASTTAATSAAVIAAVTAEQKTATHQCVRYPLANVLTLMHILIRNARALVCGK